LDSLVIAVIDDDEFQRDAIRRLLRSQSYAVHTFASAEDFLNSGLAGTSSCIVSDIQLPAMDGLALQAQLRAKGNKAPFIFITAFPVETIRARALKAGAICFLTKPFDRRTLIKCLETALESHGGGTSE